MQTKIKLCVVAFLLLGLTAFSQTTPKAESTLVSIGMKVPTFSYEAAKGQIARISDLKGKLVLAFSQCAPDAD